MISEDLKDRIALTLLLPPHLAHAMREAAIFASRLTDNGEIIMDHVIFAGPEDLIADAKRRFPVAHP